MGGATEGWTHAQRQASWAHSPAREGGADGEQGGRGWAGWGRGDEAPLFFFRQKVVAMQLQRVVDKVPMVITAVTYERI